MLGPIHSAHPVVEQVILATVPAVPVTMVAWLGWSSDGAFQPRLSPRFRWQCFGGTNFRTFIRC